MREIEPYHAIPSLTSRQCTLAYAVLLTSLISSCPDSTFSDKIPKRKNLKKEGLILTHSGRIQSILRGKSWCQEQEPAGHIETPIKKERKINAHNQCVGSFLLHNSLQISHNAFQSSLPPSPVIPPLKLMPHKLIKNKTNINNHKNPFLLLHLSNTPSFILVSSGAVVFHSYLLSNQPHNKMFTSMSHRSA